MYLEFFCFSQFFGNSRSWQNDVTKLSQLSPHKSFGIDWMVKEKNYWWQAVNVGFHFSAFCSISSNWLKKKNLRWFYITFWWCRCHVFSPDFISNVVITIMSFWNFLPFFWHTESFLDQLNVQFHKRVLIMTSTLPPLVSHSTHRFMLSVSHIQRTWSFTFPRLLSNT